MNFRFWLIGLLATFVISAAPAYEYSAAWDKSHQLSEKQQFKKALSVVADIYQSASKQSNERQMVRSLIEMVKLTIGIHGYERALKILYEKKWPRKELYQSMLHLYRANALEQYYQAYQWQIREREKVVAEKLAIEKWTGAEIMQRADSDFAKAWKNRGALKGALIKDNAFLLTEATYPKHVYSTLADFLALKWSYHLSNTRSWSAQQMNSLYKLPFDKLVNDVARRSLARKKVTENIHPILKINHILHSHEQDLSFGQRAAKLEVKIQYYKILFRHFTSKANRKQIYENYSNMMGKFSNLPWWSYAKYTHANWHDYEGEYKKAHQICADAIAKFPKSLGGKNCKYLTQKIEQPNFTIRTQYNDRSLKPSIHLKYRNLKKIHFRAYKVDFQQMLKTRNWNVRSGIRYRNPDELDVEDLVEQWSEDLPSFNDFKQKSVNIKNRLKEKGYYVLVASGNEEFSQNRNVVYYLPVNITDLYAYSIRRKKFFEIIVSQGKNGEPVKSSVHLYQNDYNKPTRKIKTYQTDKKGIAKIPFIEGRAGRRLLLVAQRGKDRFIGNRELYFNKWQENQRPIRNFIYSDRSIYRPQQKVHFKVVRARQNSVDRDSYSVEKHKNVEVVLFDANNQVVESKKLKTNAFGAASGSFVIPQGKVLGRWRLAVGRTWQETTFINVEEYKRPTFFTEIKELKKEVFLNQKTIITGHAKYYFGMPLIDAKVKYKVTRVPVYPWWYWWRYSRQSVAAVQTEVVAQGETRSNELGEYKIPFSAQADTSQKGAKSISFNFQISADVTDEGGETRTAEQVIPIGFSGVKGEIEQQDTFFTDSESPKFRLVRSNLSGVPQAGSAKLQIYELLIPRAVQEEFNDREAVEKAQVAAPWTVPLAWQREVFRWKNGRELESQVIKHGQDGVKQIALKKRSAGAYRLVYSTKDSRGNAFRTEKVFLVVGKGMKLPVGRILLVKRNKQNVGDTTILFAGSGYKRQPFYLEKYQDGKMISRKFFSGKRGDGFLQQKIPVRAADRGGFSYKISLVNDFRLLNAVASVGVPQDDKQLKVKLTSFRNLVEPGAKEKWTLTVESLRHGKKNKKNKGKIRAEILAYMYDQSLDLFAPHSPVKMSSLYPVKTSLALMQPLQNASWAQFIWGDHWGSSLSPTIPMPSEFSAISNYGVGGLGHRFRKSHTMYMGAQPESAEMAADSLAPAPQAAMKRGSTGSSEELAGGQTEEEFSAKQDVRSAKSKGKSSAVTMRSNFSETAFFYPHIYSDKSGRLSFSFTVPDSLTTWTFNAQAHTEDMRSGTLLEQIISRKELMVRPYLPRFFRAGDRATLKVVVSNSSGDETARKLSGKIKIKIKDLGQKGREVTSKFIKSSLERSFSVSAGKDTVLLWNISVPSKAGFYSFEIMGDAGNISDGELRPVAVLPSRMHLFQSRFVALKDESERKLILQDLKRAHLDQSLKNESLVVSVDGQLIYSVLKALPYLVNYPYQCTEQTINRFLSVSIMDSIFQQHPNIKKVAAQFSKSRKTQLDPWVKDDVNRKIKLEEMPWLKSAKGGVESEVVNILNPKNVSNQMQESIRSLQKLQMSDGGFPWFPGGAANTYMTIYALSSFAKAHEYQVKIPSQMIKKAVSYVVNNHEMKFCSKWSELGTFFNYVLSGLPENYYTEYISQSRRDQILKCSFDHWRKHSPLGKAYLALTLKRKKRDADAKMLMMAIMDSSTTGRDTGTHFAPEEQSWYWYNDTIESHAFTLRALGEIMPKDERLGGLVQWLLLNKKLNQWKSTRATAEVIYSLLSYMKSENLVGKSEKFQLKIGDEKYEFENKPDQYSGDKNKVVIKGDKIIPKHGEITVAQKTKGFAFASAMWHFSTEKNVERSDSDMLSVSRRFYKRVLVNKEYSLVPIKNGDAVKVGDQIEIHLKVLAKHQFEFVQLRDPRGAGFVSETFVSGYRWKDGLSYYQEIRDSATNFFVDWLPQGKFNLKYRVRANMAGEFRVGPATLQSMYAPEFGAYSSGGTITIR